MVNARGSELLIAILICFHPLITNCDVSVSEQYWHQGCYSQNIDKGPDVGGTRQDISDGSQCASFRAVECARACLKERYPRRRPGLCVECAGLLNGSRQNVSRTNRALRVAFFCQKG
uniref:Secreted protein n=1 Tax=Magallana gigas TaxID=29159 RepID=A0A8W8ME21_MAGGI